MSKLYLTPFIEFNELFRMLVKFGLAIAHSAVTKPVVIKTTNTQPGTSPRSSLNSSLTLCFKNKPILMLALVMLFIFVTSLFSVFYILLLSDFFAFLFDF